MAALWVRPLVVVAPPPGTVAGKSTPSVPDVVTPIWLKFAVTLFAQAFGTVAVPALAELAGKTKTAAAANASTASVLRRLDMSHTPFPLNALRSIERCVHRTRHSIYPGCVPRKTHKYA